MAYTTLARVQSEIKGTEAAKATGTDQQLLGYIRTVTNRIRTFRFEFEPLYMTKRYTPSSMNTNEYLKLLSLGDYLLEPKVISVNGVAGAWGTDILAYPNDGQYPIKTLRIANPSSGPLRSWYPRTVQPDAYYECIAIQGFWGMRTEYASQGLFDSGQDVPVAGLTATAATMVVADVVGPDIYNRTPLFSPGNLLRLDDELIEVVKVDTTTKTLTLLRGMRGTTAVAHLAGTAIQVWEVEPDIANCTTRQVGLLYERRASYQQITSYPDGVNITYPSDLLAELRATIQRYAFV